MRLGEREAGHVIKVSVLDAEPLVQLVAACSCTFRARRAQHVCRKHSCSIASSCAAAGCGGGGGAAAVPAPKAMHHLWW